MTSNSQGAGAADPGVEGDSRVPLKPDLLGTAELAPKGEFEAGSYLSFTLTYTAGYYGIDDSGGLRIVFRFASDQIRPQFDDPLAPSFTTVEASNNAVLDYRYDPKGNIRPWDRTLHIKVVHGFLRAGDTVTVRFGDTRQGSPGMRLQTFCEDSFEFRVLVDPIATYNFQSLPKQPSISIVAGDPHRWVAVLPTTVRIGEPFRLCIKAEDRWGNPTAKARGVLRLRSSPVVHNLPLNVTFEPGQFSKEVANLKVSEPGEVEISVLRENETVLTRANSMIVVKDSSLMPYWADLHGQSEETIGTNSARDYFLFARDKAFLDVAAHQGNDFQITSDFWAELNCLTAEFNESNRFVTVPGYEWSGNTGLGGDRNVYFASEGCAIRRSSHALVPDKSDIASDCSTAKSLFAALRRDREDAVCFAHCGGRYADVELAHDGFLEYSMEVHSSWGTFEWLLEDAFKMGYRFGIVANSDGHKGRPGASYPGTSLFGAIGGLTCLLMPKLTREAVFDCLRERHHYATTGNRLILEVAAEFETPGKLYHQDPNLGPADWQTAKTGMMGDIVHLPDGGATLYVRILGSAPIERIDLFNGLEHIETIRPYGQADLGNRIRVIWEGAEYRGRFRQVVWDGSASVSDNRILDVRSVNFFNPDKQLDKVSDTELRWQALTTGNFGGFDAWLADPYSGTLKLETPVVKCGIPIEDIGLDDERIEAGGLKRAVHFFRLPSQNSHRSLELTRPIQIKDKGDNPIYVRVTQEDGHRAWSSPIFIYR